MVTPPICHVSRLTSFSTQRFLSSHTLLRFSKVLKPRVFIRCPMFSTARYCTIHTYEPRYDVRTVVPYMKLAGSFSFSRRRLPFVLVLVSTRLNDGHYHFPSFLHMELVLVSTICRWGRWRLSRFLIRASAMQQNEAGGCITSNLSICRAS